jgi:pimeloyl-ACP methyl ester carboxylesterase
MATYVLIHGAGSDGWYWHLLTPLLRERGHDVVAPDLPCEDDAADLTTYADVVVDAVGARAGRDDLIVVAQSMGGLTAPLVCERVPVRLVVLVAAMVPRRGEAPGDWWANTGYAEATRAQAVRDGRDPDTFDPVEVFLHDLPPDVLAEALMHPMRDQSGTPFEHPWPGAGWPDVPTRVLLCRDDRFFPAELQRRVARDRLGITPDEMEGGHLPALARPTELADRLERYRREVSD